MKEEFGELVKIVEDFFDKEYSLPGIHPGFIEIASPNKEYLLKGQKKIEEMNFPNYETLCTFFKERDLEYHHDRYKLKVSFKRKN